MNALSKLILTSIDMFKMIEAGESAFGYFYGSL
jgi:hypothetical protein